MKKEKPPFTVKGRWIYFKKDNMYDMFPSSYEASKACDLLNDGYRIAQRDQHEKEQKLCDKYGI